MANTIIHQAKDRGQVDFGWLQSFHSFSFGQYHDPAKIHFGALRVLNDDTVAAGMGFGKHPHDNMEIISIPLEGELEHKDSMGNTAVIKHGDIQVMSAGTGVAHSEYNKSKTEQVKFLQIWVIPDKRNVAPRYDQITLHEQDRKNRLQQILSPNPEDAGVWIHQQAWFYLGKLDKDVSIDYTLKSTKSGVYTFVLYGDVSIDGNTLGPRDAIGVWNTDKINITALQDGTEVLVMEVPMEW